MTEVKSLNVTADTYRLGTLVRGQLSIPESFEWTTEWNELRARLNKEQK